MDLTMRRLTINDHSAILELWRASGLPCKPRGRDSREMMALEMQRPFCAFFGLFDAERMLAVGIANFDGRRGWVNRVAVHPDNRGIGLGGRMIEECESFLYELGAVVICALIEEVNSPSITTFQKAGYNCEGPIWYFTKRQSPEA